jgi:lysophospholipase L1-like esterase
MNTSFKLLVLLCLGVAGPCTVVRAQAFASEIRAFKNQDSANFPPKGAILFVGSSSFRFWTGLDQYFPGYTIINRGFGGSSFPDVIRYADDIIFPYQPKQIVIYCGDNDLASSDTISSQTVFNRFKELFELIRLKIPQSSIVFVSMKPSPSRVRQMPRELQANEWIREFLTKQKNTAFVDVYHPMLDGAGKPKSEIFKGDSLHMNAKGYAIWQKEIKPYLLTDDSRTH